MSEQDSLYERAAEEYGPALARLARGYESDSDKRRDLTQEIHLALWRSFAGYKNQCSLRTWVYRVAHNTAISWVGRQKSRRPQLLASLDEIDSMPATTDPPERRLAMEDLMAMIWRLQPRDRQIMLAYLENLDATAIGELTGLSPANVATKIHRIKAILAREFHEVKQQ